MTLKTLKLLFYLCIGLSLLADFFIEAEHSLFGLDALPWFDAIYGFSSCVFIVFLAKAMGIFLQKRRDYYD